MSDTLPPPSSARVIRVVAAVVEREGRYIITQRKKTAMLGGLWEFPGGKVEPGETDEAALAREFSHRLGVGIEIGKLISYVRHPYDRYAVDLYLYEGKLKSEGLEALAVAQFRWVDSRELEEVEFTPADEASMTKLLAVELD